MFQFTLGLLFSTDLPFAAAADADLSHCADCGHDIDLHERRGWSDDGHCARDCEACDPGEPCDCGLLAPSGFFKVHAVGDPGCMADAVDELDAM